MMSNDVRTETVKERLIFLSCEWTLISGWLLAGADLATDLVLWHLCRHWIWLGESGRLHHHVDAHHVRGGGGTYDDRFLVKAPS